MSTDYSGPSITDPISLDEDFFKPIDVNWRKKYYRRVLYKRLLAFLLDLVITNLPLIIISCFVTYFLAIGLDNVTKIFSWDNFYLDILLVFTLLTLIPALLLAWMESSRWRGTFGKRIMSIEITDDYGNSISFWRSLFRNYLRMFFSFLYILVLPALIQIFTYWKTKKLFHDQLSHTIIGERLN